MLMKSNVTRRIITLICISVFTITSVPLAADSFASERNRNRTEYNRVSRQRDTGTAYNRVSRQRDKGKVNPRPVVRQRVKRRIISPPVVRHGHVVDRLPRGYRRVWRNRDPFYYFGGMFYRPAPSGFVVVPSPIGAVVVSLPVGSRRLWIDGALYFTFGGTFYRRVPSGYVVVDAPAPVVVEKSVPVLIQPSETAGGQVFVTVPVLNVRSGPGINEPVLYQVDEGYILEVHGIANEWLYVQLPNGEYGWVKTAFTRQLKAARG